MESGPEMTRDEVVALLADRDAAHAALLRAKDAEIAAKDALISQLSARIDALEAAARKNSSTSSKPPSSDDPNDRGPAKKRSSRRKSGRQRGKQPGSSGMTLRLVDDPDDTIECPPRCCGGCGLDLAEAEVFAEQRRQVVDVPEPAPKPMVTEYRVQSKECGGCGSVTEGVSPGDAASRVQYGPGVKARLAWLGCANFIPVRRAADIMWMLLGIGVSTGFAAGIRAQAASLLEESFLPHVRALLIGAPVAHADETFVRAEAKLRYLHIACTDYLTVMHVGNRSADTIDAGGIWPEFTGVLVRDGYAGYSHLDKIKHAWCHAHLQRDLRAIHEADESGQSWAEAMGNTLILANTTACQARAQGRDQLTDTELTQVRSRYLGALAKGLDENQASQSRLAKAARTLIRRFQKHEAMILRFCSDLRVPFTNNVAERDVRPAKVQQRASGGCWRTLEGLAQFAIVQSYLSTARKWGIDQLDALTRLFKGDVWLPAALTPTAA
jgi:transposase